MSEQTLCVCVQQELDVNDSDSRHIISGLRTKTHLQGNIIFIVSIGEHLRQHTYIPAIISTVLRIYLTFQPAKI